MIKTCRCFRLFALFGFLFLLLASFQTFQHEFAVSAETIATSSSLLRARSGSCFVRCGSICTYRPLGMMCTKTPSPTAQCYANATCTREKSGACGWVTTPAVRACLAKVTKKPTPTPKPQLCKTSADCSADMTCYQPFKPKCVKGKACPQYVLASFCVPKKCTPRPACLSATPRCMIAEPVGGWCKPSTGKPTPTPKPITTYQCPGSAYVDCMPKVASRSARTIASSICSPGYLSWAKEHCPGFKGAAY